MGNGRVYFDGSSQRYLVDLSVVSKYNATAHEDWWEACFRQASRYLFDATLGQMQLGSIGFLNDGTSGHNDVRLNDKPEHSTAFGARVMRALDEMTFDGHIKLTRYARTQPLEATHELGHYVIGLMDEYVECGSHCLERVCTQDATSGACIMEHAFNHGVVLSPGPSGTILTTNPLIPVTKFCHPSTTPGLPHEHLACSSVAGCGANPQESTHGVSCWETLAANFSNVKMPGSPGLPTHSHNAITWFVRSNVKKYSLTTFGSATLVHRKAFDQIKSSMIAWARLITETSDQLAVVADTKDTSATSTSFVRDMAPIKETELNALVNSINNLERGNAGSDPIFLELDQFDPANIGAYQFMILVIPGDEEDLIGADESFWPNLANAFEEQFTTLIVVTLGRGELTTQFSKLHQSSARVQHTTLLPGPNNEFVGSSVQNFLVEAFFLETPGLGIIAATTGILTRFPFRDVFHNVEESPPTKDEDSEPPSTTHHQLLLHPQHEGIDFPAYIEKGALSAYLAVVLTAPEETEFTVIQPNGQILSPNSDLILKSSLIDNVQFYQVAGPSIDGRWILRLRRRAKNQGKQDLPFHFVVGSNNREISISTSVSFKSGKVHFTCSTFHDEPLDFVESKVDIFTLQDFGINPVPIQSVVLKREVTRFRQNEQDAEIIAEVSTGVYRGQTVLKPGDYVAVLQSSNYGNAVHANNYYGSFFAAQEAISVEQIPAFSRIDRKYFTVPDH